MNRVQHTGSPVITMLRELAAARPGEQITLDSSAVEKLLEEIGRGSSPELPDSHRVARPSCNDRDCGAMYDAIDAAAHVRMLLAASFGLTPVPYQGDERVQHAEGWISQVLGDAGACRPRALRTLLMLIEALEGALVVVMRDVHQRKAEREGRASPSTSLN